MSRPLAPDLCVIGAGSGGLAVAAGASQMGAKVVLIERGMMGGDCLNFGCVPSKSLLATARAADLWRRGAALGLAYAPPRIDFAAVGNSVQHVIAGIAPNDSAERFEGLGVKVLRAEASFTGPRTMRAGGVEIRPRRFVIATGSRPAVPAITVLDVGPLLPRDDPELAASLAERLAGEGIVTRPRVEIAAVERDGEGILVHLARGERIAGSHLLVAAGRRPNIEALDLSVAGIAATATGITVDPRLRTTNRRAFAVGDVAGGPQFTHIALYHAGIVIRNALFRLPAKVDYRALPWVTYTDPELAQVGVTEATARTVAGALRILRWRFAENDRAQTERDTAGSVKVVARRDGRILGASILGAGAGDLILPWALAISQKLKIGALANLIVPYPTRGEASKRAAGSFYTPALFSARTRRLVHLLARFG